MVLVEVVNLVLVEKHNDDMMVVVVVVLVMKVLVALMVPVEDMRF